MLLSKETSLFNKDAVKEDIQVAGQKATSYITEVSNDGMFVHQTDTDKDGDNPTESTAYGVHISDDIDIIRGGVSVATYGTNTRIGKETEGNVLIDNDSVDIMDGTTNLATFGANSISIGKNSKTAEIQMCGDGFKVSGAYIQSPLDFIGDTYVTAMENTDENARSKEIDIKNTDHNLMSLGSYNNGDDSDFTVFCINDSTDANIIAETDGEFSRIMLTTENAYLQLDNGKSGEDGEPTVENVTIGARLRVPNDRIQNQYAYNNTVTYKPNMYIGTTGLISRTTHDNSSKRYKHDIKDVTNKELDPHRLYDIEVKQFKFNDDVVTDENDPRRGADLIGFIAEQVAECYPVAVDINEDGDIESWSAHYIVPPMLALLQEQHKEIEALKEQIKQLKK